MGKKNVHPIVSGAGWIGSFAGMLVDELEDLGVPFEEIHKLGKPAKDGKALVRACAEKIAEMRNGIKSNYLKLIPGAESLMLDATSGEKIIAEAKDVFSYIDSDFKGWKADEKGSATEETAVGVYEMTEDATFAQMFGSLSPDINKLCLTQEQIINFCQKHRQHLRKDGYGTFFLFKSNNRFFVAHVRFDSDDTLEVFVNGLGVDRVWNAGSRRRVVVPRLA